MWSHIASCFDFWGWCHFSYPFGPTFLLQINHKLIMGTQQQWFFRQVTLPHGGRALGAGTPMMLHFPNLGRCVFFQATVASRPGLECWQGWNYVFMGVAWMHWLRKRCKGPQRKYAVSMVFVCFSAPRFVRRYVLLYISVVRLDCKFDDILFVWGFQVYIKVVIFLESQWIAVSCGCVVHADSVRIAYP